MTAITCTCQICKANAAKLGVEILGANIPTALAALTTDKKARHGLVYNANDPSAVGKAVRARTGITAL